MKQNPWYSLIGLAFRAGFVTTGEEAVLSTIRSNKAKLVIVAEDASERTRKTFQDKCSHYHVPIRLVADRYKLGAAIGKAHRVVASINDKGFSDKMMVLLDQ